MEIVRKSKGFDDDKNIHIYFKEHWLSLFPQLGDRTFFCAKRQILGQSSRKFAKILSEIFYRQKVVN
jgi:hypothetical protein